MAKKTGISKKKNNIEGKNASRSKTTGSPVLILGKSGEICVLWCIIVAGKCNASNRRPVFVTGCVDTDENSGLCVPYV